MRLKSITICVVVVAVLSLMLAPGAIASEHVNERNDTEENSTENSIEIGVGQSLSVAVDNVSAQVEKQVSDVARKRSLGEASSESERAKILSEDLIQKLTIGRENVLDLKDES